MTHSSRTPDVVSPAQVARGLTELWSRVVVLREGEAFVAPKGVRHNPIAEQECHIMLIERKSTLHPGSEVTAKTRTVEEQLRPL